MIPWLHEHAPVPSGTRTDRVQLRPLRATDVDRDYDAVMASREQLRRWGQTEWPAETFTLAENRADLERHEREHEERVAYTFTVFDPAGARCLGCVYLAAPSPPLAALLGDATNAAQVGFWVRTDELASELDAHLLATLRSWLASEWSFDRVAFLASTRDERQRTLMAGAGLVSIGTATREGGRTFEAFVER